MKSKGLRLHRVKDHFFDQVPCKEAADRVYGAREDKKRSRKPKARLEDVSTEDKISLADLVEEQRIIEGVHDVTGHVYDLLGYNDIFKRKNDKELLKDLVLLSLSDPETKLKTQQLLGKNFARTHHLDTIYRLMDKVHGFLSTQTCRISSKSFSKNLSSIRNR